MELLKPNLISGEILTLIEEAKERIVLVSPYVKISKWFRLVNKIKGAQERGVEIDIYVREGETETIKEVEQLGITPHQVKNLHSKFYYNEKYGVVTSLNLLLSSEINSLEIAYKTSTRREYRELCDFREMYLVTQDEKEQKAKEQDEKIRREEEEKKKAEQEKSQTIVRSNTNWKEKICRELTESLAWNVNIYYDVDRYVLQTGNRYEFGICSNNSFRLNISGILTAKEFSKAANRESLFSKDTGLNINFFRGGNRSYDTVWGEFERNLSSTSINKLTDTEIKGVMNSIVSFVQRIEKFKSSCR